MNNTKNLINLHLNNLTFYLKVTSDGYYQYFAKITSMYGNKIPYIILFVKKDRFITVPKTIKVSDVEWDAVRTIFLKHNYNIKEQNLNFSPVDSILCAHKREKNVTIYKALDQDEYIELIHDPSKNTAYQYPINISMTGALETFAFLYKPSAY